MYKHKRADKSYLEDNQSLDALIKELVTEFGDDIDGYKSTDECIEALECMSRDGFIASSYNCGGYEFNQFTDVNSIVGSGSYPASKVARKVIDEQYAQSCEYAKEWFIKEYAELIKRKRIPKKKINYHDLYELGLGTEAERLSEAEYDNASEDTIMYQLRVMYHGIDNNGNHSVSVSASVNWEAPYHRSHISWMPGYKCEDFKEVTIEFKTLKQAKSRITKALKQVKEEIIG